MGKGTRRIRIFVKRYINPILRHLAMGKHGPFALLRHVGRNSGKAYETPIMLWHVKDGFVIMLTYGPHVDWLRNLQAAGQGSLLLHNQEYHFQKPALIDKKAGFAALPSPIRQILQLLGAQYFVKLPKSL
ncbi:peptidase [Ktedonobacteria bacterium brp13]|nr:peptidase [Ktedonobacteria bacterium brp13]